MTGSQTLILAVDDQPTILEVLVKILRNREQELLLAGDSREALAILEETRPDLILLDVVMPGIDGFELCRQLKDKPATRDIPVIFTTALDRVEDKVRGFSLGAVDYITKPFFKEEVRARVKIHLELRRKELALQKALEEVKTLSGILPICSHCKKIRNDQGYWEQVEKYITSKSEARFSHGLCPSCYQRELAQVEEFIKNSKKT